MRSCRYSAVLMGLGLLFPAAVSGTGCGPDPVTISLPKPIISDGVRYESATSSGIDLSLMGQSVSPGDDFYAFANGSWLEATTIPDDYDSYGFYTEADERVRRDLLSLIQSTEPYPAIERLAMLVRTLYSSGMDQTAIDSVGLSALAPELNMIDGLRTLDDVPRVLAHLQLIGVAPFFKVHRPASWELLGPNHLYLRQTSVGIADGDLLGRGAGQSITRQYRDYMIQTFARLGESLSEARSLADSVVAMEQQLAASAMSPSELRDVKRNYNIYSSRKLKKLIPGFDWSAFFHSLDVKKSNRIVVGQPKYFREIGRIFAQADWELVRAYMKWTLVCECAPLLSLEFARPHDEFKAAVRKKSLPRKPRPVAVADVVNREAPDALGALYLYKFFKESTRAKVHTIFTNLKVAFGQRLDRNNWLSEKTKKAALKKLAAMRLQMGGPESLSYDGIVTAQAQFLRNVLTIREYRMRAFLDSIGDSLDPDKWDVPAQSTNAWYRAYRNVILLPAGGVNQLLRPEVDDAYNYGVFGTHLAHEMTHGFDRQGRLYDCQGKRADWWGRSDIAAFRRKARQVEAYYGAFTVLDGEHLNGEKTLNENIADLGGFCIALDAYLLSLGGAEPPTMDGFSGSQRFFLAYAQKWREVLSDFVMRSRLQGWHAPPQFRTNGPIYHNSMFYEMFPCTAFQKGFLVPDKRITIW